uniref:Uncharacterized protein n=1 Tax=Geospiza parvula TaxID=87175 RepID=A0A8U8C2T6_GEOPR
NPNPKSLIPNPQTPNPKPQTPQSDRKPQTPQSDPKPPSLTPHLPPRRLLEGRHGGAGPGAGGLAAAEPSGLPRGGRGVTGDHRGPQRHVPRRLGAVPARRAPARVAAGRAGGGRQGGARHRLLRGHDVPVPGRVHHRRPLHGLHRGDHVAREGDHGHQGQRRDQRGHGAHLERDRLQPDADGAGLLGARDPPVAHRGVRAPIPGRRAGPGHHRGQRRLQHVRGDRRVRVRHPGGREPPHQTPARLLRHGLVEHLRLHLALPHPGRHHAGCGAGVGGLPHLALLPGLRGVRLGGRQEAALLQVRLQALPRRPAQRHHHRHRGRAPAQGPGGRRRLPGAARAGSRRVAVADARGEGAGREPARGDPDPEGPEAEAPGEGAGAAAGRRQLHGPGAPAEEPRLLPHPGHAAHDRRRQRAQETRGRGGAALAGAARRGGRGGRGDEACSRIFFEPCLYHCLENCGSVTLAVACQQGLGANQTFYVDFRTEDGSAKAGSDYEYSEGTLIFKPGETRKELAIGIIDDDIFEEDEHFFVVRLLNLRVGDAEGMFEADSEDHPKGKLVAPLVATVTILDDDHAGIFGFRERSVRVSECQGHVEVTVVRSLGARGTVMVPFRTVEGTARGGGVDYEDASGELEFRNDETAKTLQVKIVDDEEYEKKENFFIELGTPRWLKRGISALLLAQGDGERALSAEEEEARRIAEMGKPVLGDNRRLEVVIEESYDFKNTVDKLMKKTNLATVIGTHSWREQFLEAITVSAGDEDEDDEGREERLPSCFDYVMHFLTVFWKVLFACVPPTALLGGWAAFGVSILLLALLTALIGDLAAHFGCTLGLKDSVNAVVFVALGTSIPGEGPRGHLGDIMGTLGTPWGPWGQGGTRDRTMDRDPGPQGLGQRCPPPMSPMPPMSMMSP